MGGCLLRVGTVLLVFGLVMGFLFRREIAVWNYERGFPEAALAELSGLPLKGDGPWYELKPDLRPAKDNDGKALDARAPAPPRLTGRVVILKPPRVRTESTRKDKIPAELHPASFELAPDLRARSLAQASMIVVVHAADKTDDPRFVFKQGRFLRNESDMHGQQWAVYEKVGTAPPNYQVSVQLFDGQRKDLGTLKVVFDDPATSEREALKAVLSSLKKP